MSEKRTVRLGGELGEKFVKEFAAYVDSVAEAIRMLEANWPGFAQYLRDSDPEKVGYRVTLADRDVVEEDDLVLVSKGDILIMPVIGGASAGLRVFTGAVIAAVGFYFGQSWAFQLGVGMMIGGAIELLTPIPKQPDWQAKDGKPNYWFNGAQQTSAQGLPIPIGTGTMLIAGTVISAGVSVEDIGTGSLPTNSPVLV
ncbi:hypothetical protein [Chromobacterium piscinae]|uniref:hypothetical protein n=1 Tax=Chromobacterium piscinae TaxID=686831 RepID=UPI001C8C7B15|nr:hypothetical protein [Chromobacterium vaccinii]